MQSARNCAIALMAGLFPAVMVLCKVRGFNGPAYWPWHYGHDSLFPFLFLAIPVGALLLWAHARLSRPVVAALVAAQVFLMFSYVGVSKDGMRTIALRIHDPVITSYYTVALGISDVRHWISHYDQLLPAFPIHAQTHPPGAILYFFAWRRALGARAAIEWGGISIGLAACLAVPAMYLLTRWLTTDVRSGLLAAMVWTTLPGIIVLLPVFDQVYPIFTIALVYLWTQALIKGGTWHSIGFAAVLFVALLFSYAFFVLGAYFVLSAVCAIGFSNDRAAAWRRVARAAAVSLLVLSGLLGGLRWFAGYNYLAALRQTAALQDQLVHLVRRPYPWHVPWDAYDFLLASGWIPGGLLVLAASRIKNKWGSLPETLRVFVPSALGCLLIVAASGLVPGEAARLWLFLQPFVIALAGIELAGWSKGWRLAACGLSLVILAVIRARLVFFSPSG